MYKRWQELKVTQALKTRRVLLLSGPRQCGKTTLATSFAKNSNIYRTIDDPTLLNAAHLDPHSFIKHDNELMIIDEIQRCPELLMAIKMDVDFNNQNGRYLLTGSANIQSLSCVKESLAGRVRHLRLRPLNMGEIKNTQPTFLKNVFKSDLSTNTSTFNYLKSNQNSFKEVYIECALKGGYPEPLFLSHPKEIHQWYQDYVRSLIQKDLKEITNIKRLDTLQQLLIILAAWSSRFIDFNAIGSGLSLSRSTIQTYVNAIEMLYLVERVPAWTKTIYDRVGKKDKLFMSDTGVMSSLLNFNKEKVMLDGALCGILLETFVCNQLSSLIEASEESYQLFHYRDKLGREIDFIIENDDNQILGIEVKAGTSISDDSFKHLKWFKDNLAKDKKFTGIVLYTGTHPLSFGKDLWALPIQCLWNE